MSIYGYKKNQSRSYLNHLVEYCVLNFKFGILLYIVASKLSINISVCWGLLFVVSFFRFCDICYNFVRHKCIKRNNRNPEIFGRKVEDNAKYGKSITRGYTPHVNRTSVTQRHTRKLEDCKKTGEKTRPKFVSKDCLQRRCWTVYKLNFMWQEGMTCIILLIYLLCSNWKFFF